MGLSRYISMTDNNQELFVPQGHFYSPITDADEAKAHIDKIWEVNGPIHGINFDDTLMRKNWDTLSTAAMDIPFSDTACDAYRYHYQNDQFSYGDACMYYAYLKVLNPKTVIEIGSGYSSALALDFCGLFDRETQLTFIEPYPQRLEMLLEPEDKSRIRVIEDKVQNVEFSVFEALQENDILFIDSSHVAKTGSDVCYEIFEILPRLRPGVFILIHDMFYPFEYPQRWAVEEGRSWNEAYLIRALLMHSDRFSIEFFNHYFALKFPDLTNAKCPTFMKNCGGSLWLKVNDY